ncbi:ATP-binding protein [Candidatus Gottesmanbacteria bacterium]|nr:ATP-binding protein [Candidatus Gottesmanbacteria bacterium]
MLIILHGLPGVGKSTLAQKLSEITGALVLGTNHIRRNILGCNAYQCANVPLMPFSKDEILLSYRIMLYCAELMLQQGKNVILDATFQKIQYIEMAKEVAQKMGVPVYVVKVVCDEDECKKRMDERVRLRKSDSIVDYKHHVEVKEKIFEEYPNVSFSIDTSKDLEPQYAQFQSIVGTNEPQSL